MSLFVKICGMTEPAGVMAAVEGGADAVGFVFYSRSPRNLSASRARELAALVPTEVLTVAVMLHPDADACSEALEILRPDVLQTDAADFAYLDVPEEVRKWPVVRESLPLDPDNLKDTYIYEGAASGKGQRVDWQRAAELAHTGRMILAGGLSVENVAEAVGTVQPWGVDVSSAVESGPGRKDPDLIKAFIAAARAA